MPSTTATTRTILAAGLLLLLLAALGCGGGGGGGTGDLSPATPGGTEGVGSGADQPGQGGGSGAEKPAALPTYGEVDPYSATSPLKQKIPANPRIDPESDRMVELFAASGPLVVQVRQYSAPVYIADETTPRRTVELPCGPWWELGVSRMVDVPIPEGAEPAQDLDGAANPAPSDTTTCGEDADQDNHLIVLDLKNGCEYDFWQFRWVGGTAAASWGNAISLDSTGIYPGALSTRGSGFAFLAGLIWPDELEAGRIGHALVFNYPYTRAGGPVEPATATDGVWDGTEPELGNGVPMPEGARLQLDPNLNLDDLGLEPYEKTIARALQEYGMFLVDTGGSSGIGLYAIDPRSVQANPYEGLLPDGDFVELPHIPLDRFRVLETGQMDLGWQQNARLPEGPCAPTFQ